MLPNSYSFSFKLLHNPDVGHGGCWSESLCGFPAKGEIRLGPVRRQSQQVENYITFQWSGILFLCSRHVPGTFGAETRDFSMCI